MLLTCPDPEDVFLSLCESSGQVLSGGGVSWAGDPVVGPVLGLLDDVAGHFGAAVVFRNVPHQLDHVFVNVLEIKKESAVEREQCRCHNWLIQASKGKSTSHDKLKHPVLIS